MITSKNEVWKVKHALCFLPDEKPHDYFEFSPGVRWVEFQCVKDNYNLSALMAEEDKLTASLYKLAQDEAGSAPLKATSPFDPHAVALPEPSAG